MSMEIGAELPKFKLKDQNGNNFSITDVKGKKPVVIYFYPKNFTPGCTKEACSFRDAFQDFSDEGAIVIGISSDSEASHKKFASKYNLPFTLLADSNKEVRKLFGVKNNLLGLLPGRETFVFDESGKLTFKFNAMGAEDHIKKALIHLKKSSV